MTTVFMTALRSHSGGSKPTLLKSCHWSLADQTRGKILLVLVRFKMIHEIPSMNKENLSLSKTTQTQILYVI